MAYKQSQDHCGYMDGVKVKISERYKPPPKITLPVPYSQRIELNKHIRDNIPSYDFTLEKAVKEKMKEWRDARLTITNERRERLDKLKEVKEKEKEERVKREEEYKSESDFSNNYNNLRESAVLIPTQVDTNSILTPTPLGNLEFGSYTRKTVDKSPFNISDFDPDTSSPFDNLALKSINDMAELALVLQNEEKTIPTTSKQGYPYNDPAIYTQTYSTSYDNTQTYLYQPSTSANSYNFLPNSNNTYNNATTTTASNGLLNYYGNFNPGYAQSYSYKTKDYSKITDNNVKTNTVCTQVKVPDIMKALQTELDNNKQVNVNHVLAPGHGLIEKDTAPNDLKVEMKIETDECYRSLPAGLQKMAKEVSSMGFQLDRVARACKLIGDDHKKIVEHLLVMSELLDLGFPEPDVSKALLQCDNDRDKALDRLIS